jgi:hypothetical protein
VTPARALGMPPRRRAAAGGGAGGAAAGGAGDGGGGGGDARPIFLTVGTTSFDALVAAADTPAFLASCAAKGYTSLTMQARAHTCGNIVHNNASCASSLARAVSHNATQLGRGTYLPCRTVPPGATEARTADGFVVRCARVFCCPSVLCAPRLCSSAARSHAGQLLPLRAGAG